MRTERELKYSLLDAPPDAAELAAAFHGSQFVLEPRGTSMQRDAYYDDAAGTLRRSGVALRRRRSGATEVAAVKLEGTVDGPAHERDELEQVVEGGRWPAAIVEALEPHLGGSDVDGLTCVVELETERTAYGVRRGESAVATLVFDAVEARYPGGERSALFREAEVEAHVGVTLASLHDIAELVGRSVALTPSGVTKLQRAEALLLLGASL